MKFIRLLIIFLISLSPDFFGEGEIKDSAGAENPIRDIYKKKEVRILITDSGLGGISVAAGLEEKLEKLKCYLRNLSTYCRA